MNMFFFRKYTFKWLIHTLLINGKIHVI